MVKSILCLALAALSLTFGESLAGPPIKDAALTGSTTVTLLNGLTITPTSSATLSITNGKTLSIGSSLSFTGTDGTSFAFPSTGGTVLTSSAAAGISGIFTFGSPSNVGKLRIAGASSGNTTVDASAAASGTLTLPAATDTLVGRATTDTLTNKSISGASNTLSNINLASQVVGTLPIANGGDGVAAKPAFSVHKNGTNQSVPSNTFTELTWSTEVFDTDGAFASNAFTPQVAGKYLLILSVKLAAATSTNLPILNIYKNGALHRRLTWSQYVSTGDAQDIGSVIVEANGSTDTFKAFIFVSDTAARNVEGADTGTYFQGYFIRP